MYCPPSAASPRAALHSSPHSATRPPRGVPSGSPREPPRTPRTSPCGLSSPWYLRRSQRRRFASNPAPSQNRLRHSPLSSVAVLRVHLRTSRTVAAFPPAIRKSAPAGPKQTQSISHPVTNRLPCSTSSLKSAVVLPRCPHLQSINFGQTNCLPNSSPPLRTPPVVHPAKFAG